MKKPSLQLAVLLILSAASFSQTLSQAERDRAAQYLQQTNDGVIATTKGLSEAQMKFKPAPDRWSVGETLEHITLAEDFLLQNITGKIMKAPAGPADRDTAKLDAMILGAIPDRSQKSKRPGHSSPQVAGRRQRPSTIFRRVARKQSRSCNQLPICASMPPLTIHSSSDGRVRLAAVHRCAQRAPYEANPRGEG
ncbi:MAG TPA: DinB family protein [Terriglobales bacterium]|nr:DinB family protein [Terriglobales bacterium]